MHVMELGSEKDEIWTKSILHFATERQTHKTLLYDYFWEGEELQSTVDRKYGKISLLVPFEPPLTAGARYNILDLTETIKYGFVRHAWN